MSLGLPKGAGKMDMIKRFRTRVLRIGNLALTPEVPAGSGPGSYPNRKDQ